MGNTDSIPVISQAKSLWQVMSGDVEGARRTQENFRDKAPVVSQVTSFVHSMEGDNEKAREVQEKFADSVIELTDGLPIVGHMKGGLYYALGDKQRGDQTMKAASGSLVSMAAGAAGFAVGGPAGAAAASLAASHAYDGIVTGIDTAVNGKRKDGSPRFHGSWDSYDRVAKGKASSGDIFDTFVMPAVDAASGMGGKLGRAAKKSWRKSVGKVKGRLPIRCKRDTGYHLTHEEGQFATRHQQLPGSVSDVLKTDWQHLNPAQTVSNLVSLFVILRLILWNDKNGRSYSQEVCTMTTDYYNVEKCQKALLKTLERMDEHLAAKREDSDYVLNPPVEMMGITNNSTVLMVRLVATLYGILDSIGRADSMGVTWLGEICMFEQLDSFRICEDEVLLKLSGLLQNASYLGERRKRRVKRMISCPSGSGQQINSMNIRSPNVGDHSYVQSYNKKTRNIMTGRKHESNHIPAYDAYPPGTKARKLTAHSLLKDVHQTNMVKVGTSKNSHVAQTLRHYEGELIQANKMHDAVKLDFVASYGRANHDKVIPNRPNNFEPALVKNEWDLHAVVNHHNSKGSITVPQTKRLHKFLEKQRKHWNKNPQRDQWIQRMETKYKKIVKQNNLQKPSKDVIDVNAADYKFG